MKMDSLMNMMLQQLASTVGGAQTQQMAHVARLMQGKKMICTTGAGRTGLVMPVRYSYQRVSLICW